jgi:chromosome segregation ATPase
MQAEFINVFLEKQRDHLMDFVSRVIMAETKQHFADKEIEDLTAKLTAAETHITEIEKERDSLAEQISAGEKHDAKRNATVEQLNTNNSDLSAEIDRLNKDIVAKQEQISQLISDKNSLQQSVEQSTATISQMNTIKMELESANKREASMAADYLKLSADHEDLKTKYREATAPQTVEVLPTPVLNKTKK